jgi:hypothetical protein
MDYQDLLLQLDGGPTAGYSVRVARSPAGESDAEPLLPPLAIDEIDRLGDAFGRAARDLVPAPMRELDENALAEMGEKLFDALFTGTVRNRYHESLGRVLAHGGCGLRLRIEMGLRNPAMARLHAIPWEYLRPAEDGHFLGLRRDLSIVRYLDVALPADRPPLQRPLAILVVAGDDPVASDLALAREYREMGSAWSGTGTVRIDLLRGATLEMLRHALLARDYHVLHIMGHGGFDPRAGRGSVALRDEQGQRVWVGGVELAEQLRDRTSLRLVFVNACWTARASSAASHAGVATALLGAGVPAVLAMQFAVSDAAALAFSRSFYGRLAQGDTIDAAVTEGRMAIRRLRSAVAEWGTPALFERLPGGRIVEAPVRSRAAQRLAVAVAGGLVVAALLSWWQRQSPAAKDSLPEVQPRAAIVDQRPMEPRSGADAAPHEVQDTAAPSVPPAGGPARGRAAMADGRRPGNSETSGRAQEPVRRSYLLRAGEAQFVEEVASWVSIEFSSLGHESYLTVHVTRHGSATLHQALLVPGDVDLGSGNGRLSVQSIDWQAQAVQVVAEPAK